jgi:AcrR family transcriptional regulator
MSRREEKSAATRLLLINATFDCLVENGYDKTSTVAICKGAGLARGTMLHHFPTRQALVLAAIEDVLLRRVADFQASLALAGTRDVGQLTRQLWTAVRGPTFLAWLELAVASRTDPVLAAEFRSVMERFDTLVGTIAATLLPADLAGEDDLKMAVSLVFSSLNGLALDLLQKDPEEVEAKVELLCRWLTRRG